MKHHDPAAIRRAKIIRTIVMVFLCVLSLLPFYLMFVNGTRTSNEVKSGISFWFGSNLLENLHNFDLKQRGLGVTALGSMVNSLLVTVPATALSVYFSALTAYGIHAYDFKLKKAAWGFILAVMMVPTPVVVFFLRQYLLGALPLEVVEAARIDGSGEFHTFNAIVLPIMKPALAVQAIFQFVANWNSLFLPSLIINSTGKKTLTMFVQMLMGESFRADYGVIFLALSITILPMFIMYFLLSRYIVEGVSLGSVKG